MPWDALTKILDASDKFLFGLLLAGLAIWQLDLGLPVEWCTGGLILAIVCGGALAFELGRNLFAFWRRKSADNEVRRERKAEEERVKITARQEVEAAESRRVAEEKKALATIADLNAPTFALFERLMCRDQSRFYASRTHTTLKALRDRNLIELESSQTSIDDSPMLIPDFVHAAYAGKRESLRKKYPNWERDLEQEFRPKPKRSIY